MENVFEESEAKFFSSLFKTTQECNKTKGFRLKIEKVHVYAFILEEPSFLVQAKNLSNFGPKMIQEETKGIAIK